MFRAALRPSSEVQDLYRYLLPVVLGVGYVSGLRDVSRETPRKPDI